MCAEKKMTVPMEADLGRVDVAESVVALIAFKEALELDGVVGTSAGIVEDIASFIRKGDAPKGVRVTRTEEGLLEIDLSIIFEYGRDVRQLASSLQGKVMDGVEKMTGTRPKSVNINLVSIHIPSQEQTSEPAPEPDFPIEEQEDNG